MGAQLVTDALEAERPRPPARPHWAKDEDSKICKSCPYRAVCWHLNTDTVPVDVPTPIKRTTAANRRKLMARKAS